MRLHFSKPRKFDCKKSEKYQTLRRGLFFLIVVLTCIIPATFAVSDYDMSLFVKFSGELASLDYSGTSVARAGDVNGDGYEDFLVGAKNSDNAGAAYLVYGQSSDLTDANLSSVVKFSGEADSDNAGFSVAGAGDVNGDGYDDVLIGAYYNDDAGSNAGAAYLVYGSGATLTSASLSTAVEFTGEIAADMAGYSVAGAGDVNNDGYDDFLVGAYGNDAGGSSAGAAYLVYGTGATLSSASLSTAVKFTSTAGNDFAGYSVASAGDVNNDGYSDILVGAYGDDTGGSMTGSTYLIYGQSAQLTSNFLILIGVELYGEVASDQSGKSVSAGDVNGDGFSDIVIGAPGNDDGGNAAGAVYIVYGSGAVLSSASLSTAVEYSGEAASNTAGATVSGTGDINGDGYADIIVGSINNADAGTLAGASYIIYGQASTLSGGSLSSVVEYTGEEKYDYSGYSVATAGDLDNDGYDEVLVGSPYNDEFYVDAGAAYILYGQAAPLGGGSLSTAVKFAGEAPTSVDESLMLAGYSVASAGDVNNDGYADFLVGSSDHYIYDQAGAAYLIYGQSAKLSSVSLSTAVRFTGESTTDEAGFSVSSAGDINNDGYSDILIGAISNNDAATDAGAVYLIYGSGATLSSASLSTAIEFTGEVSGDNAGVSVASAGDVNGDNYDDFLVGAWYNDDAGSTAGSVYLVYGSGAVLTSASLSTAVEFTGEVAGDRAGHQVASAGDVNNDGYDDILIGAYGNDDAASGAGAAYLIYGTGAALTSVSLSTAVEFTGEAAADSAGYTVAKAGDVNGDGYSDFLVGAFGNDDGGSGAGAVYLIYGSGAVLSGASLSTAVQFTGEADSDQLSACAPAGDINQDGYDDFIIGAEGNDEGGSSAGATYLVYGSGTTLTGVSVSTLDKFIGEEASDSSSYAIATAGDVNGDNYPEIIIGAFYNSTVGTTQPGAAYLGYVYIDGDGDGVPGSAGLMDGGDPDDADPLVPGSNNAPTAASVTGEQSTDGTKIVTGTVIIDDGDDDVASFKVEYSDDAGSTWYDPTLSSTVSATYDTPAVNNANTYQISNVVTVSGANTVTFYWEINTDKPDIADTDYQIRITPYDGTDAGTPAASSDFSVDTSTPTLSLTYNATSTSSSETISGTTDANALIYVDSVFKTTADGSGNFSFVMGLQGGTNSATVYAVDAFGNTSASQSVVITTPGSSGGGSSVIVGEDEGTETEEEESLEEEVEDETVEESPEEEAAEEESLSGEEEAAENETVYEEPSKSTDAGTEPVSEESSPVIIPDSATKTSDESQEKTVYSSTFTTPQKSSEEKVTKRERIKIIFPNLFEKYKNATPKQKMRLFGKMHERGIPNVIIKKFFLQLKDFNFDADSDGDGLTDGQELLYGGDPFFTDTDLDGVSDADEVLADMDPADWDSDGDGISDSEDESVFEYDELTVTPEEIAAYGDYTVQELGVMDTDLDGISDYEELALDTDPKNPDTDGDGYSDGEELINYDTDPKVPSHPMGSAISNIEQNNSLADGNLYILGYSAPAVLVRIHVFDEEGRDREIGNTVTDDTGKFAIFTDPLKAGDYLITAQSVVEDEITDVTYPLAVTVTEESNVNVPEILSVNGEVLEKDYLVVSTWRRVFLNAREKGGAEGEEAALLFVGLSPLPNAAISMKAVTEYGDVMELGEVVADAKGKFVLMTEPLKLKDYKFYAFNSVNGELISESEPFMLEDELESTAMEFGGFLAFDDTFPVMQALAAIQDNNLSLVTTWQSLVYSSTIYMDVTSTDAEKEFSRVSPEPLEPGEHSVTVYAVDRSTGEKSRPAQVKFDITETGAILPQGSGDIVQKFDFVKLAVGSTALFALLIGSFAVVRRKKRG